MSIGGGAAIAWLPVAVFAAHIVEEYPRFPAWATRRFGATSRAWYVYSHILLVALVIAVCGWAAGAAPGSWGVLAWLALAQTLGFNALFHLAASLRWREYSPGLVTGLALMLPAAAWLTWRAGAQGLASGAQIAWALVLAALVQALVIWSLTLEMDIDWRFRFGRGSGRGAA